MTEIKIIVSKDIAGKSLQFESISSLSDWVQQEQKAYQWILEIRRNFSNALWNHITAQFQIVRSQIDAINNNFTRAQPFDGHISAINSWFVTVYSGKKLYLSTSSEFKAALDLKEINPIKAATFLGHLLSLPHLYQHGIEAIEMLEGSYEHFQYTHGLSKKDLSAERQALEGLKGEWDFHLVNYKDKEDKLHIELEAIKINFNNYFQETQKKFKEYQDISEKDLTQLKETYDQFMALKAPVEYWKNKKNKHNDTAKKFRFWSIGIGLFGAFLFSSCVIYFFSDDKISYRNGAIFIFLGTLFFWTMRILVKLMLNHIHLEGDAHEREVMCQTYLALLREKTGLEETDKKLILTTLFRPSSSGLMGEDGIPPGLYDVMTKLASR